MAHININGCNIYYEDTGKGDDVIVFSHGLLWSGEMFHKQIDFLKDKYRIITYDHRGQGRSEVTDSGYDMDQIYLDAVELIEKLKLGRVHFGGLSMGGFVAMRLAARRPDLINSLILMETSALLEPFTVKYKILNMIVKLFGVKPATQPVLKIMFGDKFLNDPDRKEEREYWTKKLQSNKKSITKAVDGVIQRKSIADELKAITCPVLILVGDQDKATVVDKSRFIHENIPQSKLVIIPGAGHSASIEEPEAYNEAIELFLLKYNELIN